MVTEPTLTNYLIAGEMKLNPCIPVSYSGDVIIKVEEAWYILSIPLILDKSGEKHGMKEGSEVA